MEQRALQQYAHRVGYVLSANSFCDGCGKFFQDGQMAFRCLECSGFVCPDGNERNVRTLQLQRTTVVQRGGFVGIATNSTNYSGYDLCLACAKTNMHSHHRFTLAICQH